MLKNQTDKTQIVHLAWQVYPENISNVHLVYLEACMDQHIFDLGLKQSIKDLLRFRAKIFSGEITEVFAPVRHNESVKIRDIISYLLRDAETRDIWTIFKQACDKLITALVEFGSIKKFNHKISEMVRSKYIEVPWLYCLIKNVNCISSGSVNDSTDSVF